MSTHVHIDWDKVGRIGLYTVPMAAKLLGASGIKIRSWIDGYSNSDATPIIRRQLPPINGRTVLGFLDLIEARFVRHFDRLGLSPQSIRKVADKLRERHHTDHPFATNKRFRTDGKEIFMEIVETDEERKIQHETSSRTNTPDVPRHVANGDAEHRYVARLESEVDFLRGQVSTKYAQIKELTEGSRETNVLIGRLEARAGSHVRPSPSAKRRGSCSERVVT
jgi:hypothetical protein